MAEASGRPHNDADDEDESPVSQPDAVIEAPLASNSSLYGTFAWSVALPENPCPQDSLADISKIRQFSSVFEVGGYEWKLEMYPYGDSQSDKTLSVFLCAVDRKQLPGWSQTAHYQIAVVNKDPSKTSTHTGYDIFRGKRDSAWGWSKLISLGKLHDMSQGWVDEDSKITLQATVHVVTHEYMPVNLTYRKSLCGLYYERVLQSYFEPFLKDELHRLDKLCGNSVLHKGFSDFWSSLQDKKKHSLLKITVHEVLLNVKARLFSRDQPATYLAADVIFKAAHDCTTSVPLEGPERTLVGCTSLSICESDQGTVLRLEKLSPEAAAALTPHKDSAEDDDDAGSTSRVTIRAHQGVMRMSNSANFVDVFRAQVADALDNVRALVKHLKPQTCDGACLEAMGRHMLAVFAMCGMYITNVHPAYHEKLALQLQEDLIREEEESNMKKEAKKAKAHDKKKKASEAKAKKKEEEEAARRAVEEEKKRKADEEAAKRKAVEDEKARVKAEQRRKAQEEAEKARMLELQAAEEVRAKKEVEKRDKEQKERQRAAAAEKERQDKEDAAVDASDPEQVKRAQIAAIMRSTGLSSVEKQSRIQAILAGKLDLAAVAPPAQHVPAQQHHFAQQQRSQVMGGDAGMSPYMQHPPQRSQVPFQQQRMAAGHPPAAAMRQPQAMPGRPEPEQYRPRLVPEPEQYRPAEPEQYRPRLGQRRGNDAQVQQASQAMPWSGGGDDVDVEAFALNSMGGMGGGMGPLTDDVMALALGGDPMGSSHVPLGEGDMMPSMHHHNIPPYGAYGAPSGGFGGGSGATGSRLFERWGAAPSHDMHNHNGVHLLGPNGSDSEAELSMASTASGTRTPLSNADGMDGGNDVGGSPDGMDHGYGAHGVAVFEADGTRQRQQVAMLVGYVGSEFGSFDALPQARTVEGELLKALRKAGAVGGNDTLDRVGWTRASPTGEGEHGAAQSVAFDCLPVRSSLQGLTDRLNSMLPPDVRVLSSATCDHLPSAVGGGRPANPRFDAFDDAQSVTFECVVPSALLAPIPDSILMGGPHVMREYAAAFTMTKKHEKAVNALLRMYVTGGSKGCPWYAAQWEFQRFVDPHRAMGEYGGNTRRSIKGAQCGKRLIIGGVEHTCLQFEGAGFMHGQVRRMAGLVIILAQGRSGANPEEIMKAVLQGDPSIHPPSAPSHSILLERPSYASSRGSSLPREGWSDTHSAQQVEAFRNKLLMPQVGSPQAQQSNFRWLFETVQKW